MPGPDGPDGPDPEAAADRYAGELRAAAQPQDRVGVPEFDVLMLGIGPDAHVASLFPGLPALYEEDRTVVAVRGAPKPPPVRLSLTLPAIRAASEVWILASGSEKAGAVRLALSGAGPVQVPAAGRARRAADAVPARPRGGGRGACTAQQVRLALIGARRGISSTFIAHFE